MIDIPSTDLDDMVEEARAQELWRGVDLSSPAAPKPSRNRHAVMHSSVNSEWGTPAHVIALAREVLGTIDLDPASDVLANETVKANLIYTKAMDGLKQDWLCGTLWLNPPYGRGSSKWLQKLKESYESGQIREAALLLVPARTGTRWWQIMSQYPVCFIRGRLKFMGMADNSAPFDSAVFYLGNHDGKFMRSFKPLGDIYRKVY